MEKEQAIGRISLLDAIRGYFIAWVGLFNTLNILNAVYPNASLSVAFIGAVSGINSPYFCRK
ncbi:MAG: hypothetical protein QE277_06070 [Flectobacillus sp.]|nr:hypothetical protein [Flectobacillus sp.]